MSQLLILICSCSAVTSLAGGYQSWSTSNHPRDGSLCMDLPQIQLWSRVFGGWEFLMELALNLPAMASFHHHQRLSYSLILTRVFSWYRIPCICINQETRKWLFWGLFWNFTVWLVAKAEATDYVLDTQDWLEFLQRNGWKFQRWYFRHWKWGIPSGWRTTQSLFTLTVACQMLLRRKTRKENWQ